LASYHPNDSLPAPTPEQIEISSRLIQRIIETIDTVGGVIPFDEYMRLCLYEPGLGYYAAGSTKLGAEGDFITAPEVSPLFGRTLANYAATRFASGLERNILEFGAGSGRMCADILNRLDALNEPLQEYAILEPSPDLRLRQQEYLAASLDAASLPRVRWLDSLPDAFNGLVIGNEVLDAMPVNVVVKDRGWVELGVAFDGAKFVWREYSRSSEAVRAIGAIDSDQALPEQYCTEVNLNYAPWCATLARTCQSAEVLLIDYGYDRAQYYHPARHSGTLMCFYRHRAHPDPLVYPGIQDITAFVDFDAFAEAATAAGFAINGLTSQADFLLNNGLLQLAPTTQDEMAMMQHAQQIKTLTLPGEMGEKFRALSLSISGSSARPCS
jgi:SAM-dependent MidA family methyltransferase